MPAMDGCTESTGDWRAASNWNSHLASRPIVIGDSV